MHATKQVCIMRTCLKTYMDSQVYSRAWIHTQLSLAIDLNLLHTVAHHAVPNGYECITKSSNRISERSSMIVCIYHRIITVPTFLHAVHARKQCMHASSANPRLHYKSIHVYTNPTPVCHTTRQYHSIKTM